MRTLVESALYSHNISRFGPVERIDEALVGVTWAISIMPEDFPVVPTTTVLRVAKTEKLTMLGRTVRMRIWFIIKNADIIELLAADIIDA